eukprot:3903006-Rhodomonas_salina.3
MQWPTLTLRENQTMTRQTGRIPTLVSTTFAMPSTDLFCRRQVQGFAPGRWDRVPHAAQG